MALIRGSHVLHRLIRGNVKNLQVSDSGPLWPSCSFSGSIIAKLASCSINILASLCSRAREHTSLTLTGSEILKSGYLSRRSI